MPQQPTRLTPLARTLRQLLLGASLSLAALPPAMAADGLSRDYHIAASSLENALNQFGREAGVLISFGSQVASGVQSQGLEGSYTTEEGLNALLKGTGLQARAEGGNAFSLQPVSAEGAPAALELGTSSVVGDWLGDAEQTNVFEHPGARDVIRREAFERQGATQARDVLNRIPGVNAPENNGTGSHDMALNFGIRGLNPRLASRSTVLMDGIPVPFAPYGQPQLSFAPVSMGNMDAVDVVRGGGAVRYGPQNVGGVINFVTRAIPEKATGEIGSTLETSQRGGWKHIDTAFLGGTADNGIGAALLYSGVNGNGYRASNNGNDIDDVILKTHWAPTDQDDFSLNFHYYDAKADMPGGLTQKQYDADPYQSDRDWDNFSGRRKDVSFKYLRQIDDRTQFEVLTYYSDSFRGSTIAARDQKTLVSYPRTYYTFGIEPRVSHVFDLGPTTQEASVGMRYLKEGMHEQASRLALVNNQPVVRPGSDGHVYQDRTGGTEATAFYIDDKIDVGNWTITPGIRFENIRTEWHDRPVAGTNGVPVQEKRREINSNEPLPALSLMYHLSDAWKLFANYETSFGSLQYFQLGQGGAGDQTANGLNPEKAKTYEIGTRYNDEVWGGELTAFYIDFSDELQYISNDVGWTNLGATKHQGIEASVHYDLAALDPRLDGLTANAGFTYTRATYEGGSSAFKGRDLPFYSRQVATLGLRYDINRWTYNIDAFAQSKQRSPGNMVNADGSFNDNYITEGSADGQYGDMPGYVTWNVRGGYDFGSQLSNLKLGAGVKNLFDKQYFTRSSDNNSGLYVGAPRTFFVQASVGF